MVRVGCSLKLDEFFGNSWGKHIYVNYEYGCGTNERATAITGYYSFIRMATLWNERYRSVTECRV